MALIECRDVCKNFGEKVALDHVSLDIPKGQIFGLLGPNGAGKTTMIRIINRITIPNSGEVLFDGRPITQKDVEKSVIFRRNAACTARWKSVTRQCIWLSSKE